MKPKVDSDVYSSEEISWLSGYVQAAQTYSIPLE